MKIAPKSAEAFIANPEKDARAVLIYGPDSGLVRERVKKISSAVLGENSDPFSLNEFSEATLLSDPARLADELSSVSLLGGKRVIIISGAGDKLTKIIESAAEYFHNDVYLIVSADELSSRSSLRAWFEKSANAAAVACYKDEVRDVASVIAKRFGEAGISAPRDVTDYLAQQLGNDRFVTYQELDKIITFAGDEKRISLEEAQSLVDYNRDTELDDVVAAVADRNLRALEKALTMLLRQGAAPVAYLRALQRYFSRLYAIKGQVASGRSAEEVIQGLRPPVFFRQVPILTRHVQSWGLAHIARALKLLIAAELACKTSDMPIVAASSRRLMQITQLR